MHVITKKRLREFWRKHPQAEGPLRQWFSVTTAAAWSSPREIRTQFGSADFVGSNRVVFDIAGNKYRLIVIVAYRSKRVFIRFVGTHSEYDKIDAETV